MTTPATYAVPQTFLGIARHEPSAPICIAGIPLDLGTTNRSGARFAPAAIRQASRMLIDGAHPQSLVDPATLPLLRALKVRRGPPALVHFDAHVDTWPENFGQAYAHGSVFYHAIGEGLVQPRRMVQIGIRSPLPREVHDWTLAQGVSIISAQEVHEAGAAAVAQRIREIVGEVEVYLSFDIDALDPAFAPGTGTPEVGGLASWQAQAILRRLEGLRFVGMDVVEVAPAYDVAEITALAAATMAWEYLCMLARERAA